MTGREREGIGGLLVAQFLGAFNDHAWKVVVALLGFRAVATGITDPGGREAASMAQATTAFVVFTLPLMLFSIPAGALSDRVSKRSVIVWMKAVEVLLMAAGTCVLVVEPSGGRLALAVLGLMGLQSALFSPAKYGILPEILAHEELSDGNGRLEMWTFLAIVTGTAAGGLLLGLSGRAVWIAGAVLTACAVLGFAASRRVPRVPAARTEGGIGDTVRGAWSAIRGDRTLWLTVLGQTFFWAIASLLGQVVLVYARTALGLGDAAVALPLAVLVVGMGAGSRVAGGLSQGRVEPGWIPLGMLLLWLSMLAFGWAGPGLAGALVLLVLVGLASGLVLVPLDALLQWRSPPDRRGGVIALTNVFVFSGVLAGSLGAAAFSAAGLGAGGILVAASVATLAATLVAVRLMPIAFLRMIAVVLTHTVWRQRVLGASHVPAAGGVLLVPNHVSFVDGIFVAAAIDRPVRFVVDADYFEKPLVKLFLKPLRAIPIATGQGPKATLRALGDAGKRLDAGEVVCIFAEGQITRNGMLLPFKRGLERIVKGREVPIVPVWLHGVWGSLFSYERGRFVWKLPHQIPYPVTVAFGAPLPASTPFRAVRAAVRDLGATAWAAGRPLHHAFVRSSRHHPFRCAFTDPTGRRLRGFGALVSAIALARALAPHWADQERAGILLPPSVAGALVNLATALAGRTSVNLNYAAGSTGVASAARRAALGTVVTSRAFLDRTGVDLPAGLEVLWIEDVVADLGRRRRWWAVLLAALAPVRAIERACGAARPVRAGDVATLIFSSGSTGEPKGVMLTHGNIGANAQGAAQVFRFARDDRALGILPLFHSFGYMVLWVGAARGLGIAFAPNALDAASVGSTVQTERCTVLIATPTLLQLYVKRVAPAQFGSLRLVVAGAERLDDRVASAFEDTFGLRPLEGYGATECAPVIATSAPDFRAPGFFQPGSRRGTVGQPLPGVRLRVVDPESFEPLPPGEPGLLLVQGPNVMKGYLGDRELTETVLRDGFYVTGDIATLDEDGFLAITDRLARFSKIGGEMVPHGRVEAALQRAAGTATRVFAVTSVPDATKGERLAVLHSLDDGQLAAVLDALAGSDLPNLFRPRPADFVRVDALPLLGTGKPDLGAARRIAAAELTGAAGGRPPGPRAGGW